MEKELIIVSDWERVSADDFYLSDEWEKEIGADDMKKARELQKEGHLYIGYIVPAVDYAVYVQMDAEQIFMDEDGREVMRTEGAIIGNSHDWRVRYEV